MKKQSKPMKVTIVIVIVILILCCSAYGYFKIFMDPYRGTQKDSIISESLDTELTESQAKEDLTYIYNHIVERHPAWLETDNAAVNMVNSQYKVELDKLSGDITVLELWQTAGRILSPLHDGHTLVIYRPNEKLFINNLSEYNNYDLPMSINGTSTEDIYNEYMQISSYEVESYLQKLFQKMLVRGDFLRYYGIDTSDGVSMVYATSQGAQEYHYDIVNFSKVEGYIEPDNKAWVSYSLDAENNIGIFTLTQCINNDEYKSAVADFFSETTQNNIDNIVIDLRGNGGGNSNVANEFIKYLDVDNYNSWDSDIRKGWYVKKIRDIHYTNNKKPNAFTGNVYVLTNSFTYSSAMDFAMLIMDNDMGVLVGETSGNMPNSYGDTLLFMLPNSKLELRISYKKWYRIDKSKADEPLTPDYEVASKDALDKVFELVKNK